MRRRAATLGCCLLGACLLAGAPARAERRLHGAMPQLPASAPAAPHAAPEALAPVPNPDIRMRDTQARLGPSLLPSLTDRRAGTGDGSQGYAPGSAYSPDLARRHGETATNLGSVLAPGLRLSVPLP